ncbi:hypothetical protein C8J57DRAFT_1397745 [Mycena rebaudengoi]|nr:hypothetical protein C8J57DRAFT_1397745 [Mycena rebaudengoi]
MPRQDDSTSSVISVSRRLSSPTSYGEPRPRAQCPTCGTTVKRTGDLPRHMLTHAKNKEELMFQCPVPECGHRTLQRSNLETHIRTHTASKPLICSLIFPNGSKCNFATADPSSLHRHKKRKHGWSPDAE